MFVLRQCASCLFQLCTEIRRLPACGMWSISHRTWAIIARAANWCEQNQNSICSILVAQTPRPASSYALCSLGKFIPRQRYRTLLLCATWISHWISTSHVGEARSTIFQPIINGSTIEMTSHRAVMSQKHYQNHVAKMFHCIKLMPKLKWFAYRPKFKWFSHSLEHINNQNTNWISSVPSPFTIALLRTAPWCAKW